MQFSNNTAPAGMTVCNSNAPMPQLTVMEGFSINITMPGTPPYRLTASPQRGNTTICPSHSQNLTSKVFTWVVNTSDNSTELSNMSGDLSQRPGRSLDPVFQVGDAVQWIAHEWTPQANGQFRYYISSNYTVTSEEKSLADQAKARAGGLKVAESGVVGWLIGALLLSGVAAMGM